MEYLTRRPFKYGNRVYMPGEAAPIAAADVSYLQGQGKIGLIVTRPAPVREVVRETATVKPPEKAVQPAPEPVQRGGGWWDLPDGRKVKGREAALAAMREVR